MGTDIKSGDKHHRWGQTNTKHHGFRIQKKNPGAGWVGGWVGGLVKRDFITHSGSSEHSLDSESKFEPSVAITCPWRSHILRLHSSAFMLFFEDLLTYIDTNSSSPNMFRCVAEAKKFVLEIFLSLG